MKKAASTQKQGPTQKTPPATKPRNVFSVHLRDSQDTPDEATARMLTRPTTQAASVIQIFQGDNQEINALAKELQAQVAAVANGNLGRAEAMLVAQAHTLDEIFSALARRSAANINAGYPDAAERYMRLALKAQSQCRTTLETLAEIKNPKPVAFVQQANIATGPQQVNNGAPLSKLRAGDFENSPIKLLEAVNGERLDLGTAAPSSRDNSALAAMGEIDRADYGRGESQSR